MTQEQKQLLLVDLCARLLYKPKVKVLSFWNEDKEVEEDIVDSVYCVMPNGYINTEKIDSDISLDNIVLYLRPMSSMTEEEKKELRDKNILIAISTNGTVETTINGFDWLNAHHFDYRGLIEKGLALEATKNMYKTNKRYD